MAKKSKTSSKKSPAKGRKKAQDSSLFKRFLKWCFVLGIWGFLILGAILLWFGHDLPQIMRDASFDKRPAITFLANDGSVIARYGDHKGKNLSIDDVPDYLPDAIVAIEDRRFYYHFGVDPIGITRAFFVNASEGGFVQGGSTITQQLAKNLFLTRDRKLTRKIQEAMLAVWLEIKLSKKDILSAYMNRVYLGGGAYGVDAASRIYFKKPASALSLYESATLAGLLKAPTRYSPLSNPSLSKKRTELVLKAMLEQDRITQEEFEEATKESAMPVPDKKPMPGNDERFFTDWVIEKINGYVGTQQEDIIVETTLDPQVQQQTAETLINTVRSNGPEANFSEAASVVLRPDGSVVAMVGGVNYNQSQFNRATQALRSPGSSFKPIVYLSALRNGYDIDSIVIDEPITRGKYRPKNFGGKYYGPISLYGALTLSLNTVAVNLAKDVGIDRVIETARQLGITAELSPNLSTALGSNGVPMIEMASAYASIATNGLAVEPYGIKRILTEKDKKVLYEHENARPAQVIEGYPITQLKEMMHSVMIQGTGTGANPGFYAAGKTGTSQEYRDAWFAGFTNSYVALVWVGNDDNSSMNRVTGGSFPARAWRSIIVEAHNDPSPSKFENWKGDARSRGNVLKRIFSFGNSGYETDEFGNLRPIQENDQNRRSRYAEELDQQRMRDSHNESDIRESQRYND